MPGTPAKCLKVWHPVQLSRCPSFPAAKVSGLSDLNPHFVETAMRSLNRLNAESIAAQCRTWGLPESTLHPSIFNDL